MFQCYVSPTWLHTPAAPPPNVKWLPTIYPDGSTNVLDDPYRPRLHAVTDKGYKGPSVYDPDAIDACAAYMLSHGVSEAVLDWEASDTPENNAVLLRVLWHLRERGLTVNLYGVRDAWWNWKGGVLHPVWAPFTTKTDLFVATRRQELLDLRKANGRKVVGWAYTTYEQSGDGQPVPAGKYVGDGPFGRYLTEVFANCDGCCLWPTVTPPDPKGGWLKDGAVPDGWTVFLAFSAAMAAKG